MILTGLASLALLLQEPPSPFEKDVKPVLAKYCAKCHGVDKPKGDVALSRADERSLRSDPKLLRTLLLQVRENTMPPEGKKAPNFEERERLIAWLEKAAAEIDDSKGPRDPGRVLIRRLSRAEYNHTIRDLLGVDTRPADSFPADGSGGGGFDNIADTLYVPPLLLERYLAAAGEILDLADPKRLFVDPDARKILEYHVPRAFRRPAEPGEIDRLASLMKGASFEEGVKTAMKAVLVSPHFLFRAEPDRGVKEPYPVGDYELAARLSYFLWSSMPDDGLFALAAAKKLRDPATLDREVRRMIADPKFRAMAENFAGQWLGTDSLAQAAQPDRKKFPAFTPALRAAMQEEPVQFFLHLVRSDGPVVDLLDCDYAYVNGDLARHYGIPGVEGSEFRRVALADRARGGVLGMAGVLTLTSFPQRTSPVLRGKWVLEEIFGTPAPPPPMNVGLLPTDDKPKDGLSFRKRLEQHRAKPDCAACHSRMDPIGFGLENFDPIGRWRTEIGGVPVDAAGEFASGAKFTGPAGLKRVLMGRRNEFLRNLAEKMLSYALGRGLEHYDAPAVKAILDAVARDGARSSAMIGEVVRSYPFQYRREGAK